jgi:hypothetical protein
LSAPVAAYSNCSDNNSIFTKGNSLNSIKIGLFWGKKEMKTSCQFVVSYFCELSGENLKLEIKRFAVGSFVKKNIPKAY